MHDDLLEVAARRARAWLVVLAVVAALGPGVLLWVLAGPVAGVVAGVVAAVGVLAWTLAGAPGLPRAGWPAEGLAPAGTEVAGLAAGIAIATGGGDVPAWEVAHSAPNVGAFRSRSGLALVVTDGARELLTRDQLEAVCA